MDRFMKRDNSSGLAIRETIRDADSAMVTVFGRKPMYSPVVPVIKRIGRNAAMVVRVAEITGAAISETPSMTAVSRSLPSW